QGSFFAILRFSSLVTALVALGLAAIFVISSIIALSGRSMLTWIFPRVATLANVLNGIFLLLIGIHLVVLLWALYASSTGSRPSFGMLALVAAGVLAGVGRVLTLSMAHRDDWEVISVDAQRLDPRRAPSLMRIVEETAEEIHAPVPDHVLIGLKPEIWITSLRTRPNYVESALKGRTLYVSLPLMRVMSTEELIAAIAHEMAHFRHDEQSYTEQFSPNYRRVSGVFRAMNKEEHPLVQIAMVPARAAIRLLVSIFEVNVGRVAIARERRADRIAQEVAGGQILAQSLAKQSAWTTLWDDLAEDQSARARGGLAPANDLSVIFSEAAYVYSGGGFSSNLMTAITSRSTPHLFDPHPATGKRLRHIPGSERPDISPALLEPALDSSAADLLQDEESLGRDLTRLFNDQARGDIEVAPGLHKEYMRTQQRALISLVADVVCCGVDEIDRAQYALDLLTERVDGFDRFDLFGLLSGRIASPPFEDALETLRQQLPPQAAREVVTIVKEVAKRGPTRLPDQQAEYLALVEQDLLPFDGVSEKETTSQEIA
ncbi:MAG: M48 family metalloprotease, partial [Pseudomonadota bacterium]